MSQKKLIRKTKRLVVRPYVVADYPAWKESFSTMLPKKNAWDRERRKADELTKQQFQKILRKQAANRKKDYFYDFGVFSKEGSLVGNVSLMELTRGVFQNAYLGYSLFNPHWGKGYAKEAVAAAIDIGFRDLKLHRVEAGIEPKNKRSIALAKAVGLRREGLSPRRLFLNKQWLDILNYAATSEEFDYKWKPTKRKGTDRF